MDKATRLTVKHCDPALKASATYINKHEKADRPHEAARKLKQRGMFLDEITS